MNWGLTKWEKIMRSARPAWTSYQILVSGFACLIFCGTLLLSLPISTRNGESLRFIDAFFTSTSAVCVTGLTLVDTGSHFSIFGQLVILILIQVGGLGIMTASTVIALLVGKKIQLKERLAIQESFNHYSSSGLVRLVIYVIKLTFIIEFIGGVLLTIFFWSDYGIEAIYLGFWHAISSFCNAGFDIFAQGTSYSKYVNHIGVNLTLTLLIIIGGLGFFVLNDIYQKKNWKKLEAQSKLVLTVTLAFLIIGTLGTLIIEFNNPQTLGRLPFFEKWLISFTQAVSRTAGVTTIDINQFYPSTFLLFIFMMFVGASPGSTGGGIKTSTFGIIVTTIFSVTKGKRDVEIFCRRVPNVIILRAFVIIFVSIAIVLLTTWLLTLSEDQPFLLLLFEATSAFSTAGLSTTISPELSDFGKLLVIITMFIGRVGMLTFIMSFALRNNQGFYHYPDGKFRIG